MENNKLQDPFYPPNQPIVELKYLPNNGLTKSDTISQSAHSGIEIQLTELSERLLSASQSAHSGIEIKQGKIPDGGVARSQSAHSGIEI